MYYQRRLDRLHFCRPALHTLLHAAQECSRIGPGAYSTQFTLEHTIGYLGGAIRQPSNMFGNLCQIALRLAQANALKTSCPSLDEIKPLPQYSHDCGNNFALLRPHDRYPFAMSNSQIAAFSDVSQKTEIKRWGRLQLPNGQVARSLYSEQHRNAPNI